MKKKANRLDAIKMIISSKEVGSQEELLQELNREGFELTQADLSHCLQTKVLTLQFCLQMQREKNFMRLYKCRQSFRDFWNFPQKASVTL